MGRKSCTGLCTGIKDYQFYHGMEDSQYVGYMGGLTGLDMVIGPSKPTREGSSTYVI